MGGRVEHERLGTGGHRVDRRRFHRAGARGGQDQNVVRGLKNLFEARRHIDDHFFCFGRSVMDHRPGQFEKNVLGDRRWPRRHQSRLPHFQFPQHSSQGIAFDSFVTRPGERPAIG